MKRMLTVLLWTTLGIVLVLAVVAGVRYAGAVSAVAAYEANTPAVLGPIGVTEHLTILPLFEKATHSEDLIMLERFPFVHGTAAMGRYWSVCDAHGRLPHAVLAGSVTENSTSRCRRMLTWSGR